MFERGLIAPFFLFKNKFALYLLFVVSLWHGKKIYFKAVDFKYDGKGNYYTAIKMIESIWKK